MERLSQTYEEKAEEVHKFIVFFLDDDEDQSVRVEEVEEVDFFEVIQHINLGGSIFITHRRKPSRSMSSRKTRIKKRLEELKKPWYFARI